MHVQMTRLALAKQLKFPNFYFQSFLIPELLKLNYLSPGVSIAKVSVKEYKFCKRV